jgi:peptidoglycan-N-acetylglucosamine deacetylase
VRVWLVALLVAVAVGGAWTAGANEPRAARPPPRPEPTVVAAAPAAHRYTRNPQYEVELVHGYSIETRGAFSGRVLSARFRALGPPVRDNAVALTFDDGPSEYTARFVWLLEQLGVPATFFMVGAEAERYPHLVRLVADAGMAIGNHSYSHPWRTPFAELPRQEILAEIDRGRTVLRRFGFDPILFRPPGGTFSHFVIDAARARGERVVIWSVDARDWVAGTTADEIAARVLRDVQPGSIVVMHDGGGDREATLEALPRIIAGIRSRGLALVPLAPVG